MKQPSLASLAAAAFSTLLSIGCSSQTESEEPTGRQSESVSQAPVSPGPTSQAPTARAQAPTSAALTAGVGMQTRVARQANTVELRIESTAPFLLGALPPVLVVGDKAFGRSKHPPDGSANVLIFMIDAKEYAALPAGAEVSVGYLSSSARLVPGEPASSFAPATGPRIEPSQVEPTRRRLGVLQAGGMEVVP